MARLGGAALRVLLAATLVVGLLPATAFATGENPGKGPEEDLSARSASPEKSEEETAEENDAASHPIADDAASADKAKAADGNPVDETPKPVQEIATEEEPAGIESPAASKEDEQSNSGTASTETTEPAQEPAMTEAEKPAGGFEALDVGQPFAVTLKEGDVALFSFTAQSEGVYRFCSSGDYDTVGYLFGDETLSDQLAFDDDNGGGSNFLITTKLAAGQTVYIKAGPYSEGSAASFAVEASLVDEFDLSAMVDIRATDAWMAEGAFLPPQIVIYTSEGASLVQGRDFEIEYYLASDGATRLEGTPSEVGYYHAVVKGMSPYHGSNTVVFWLYDERDVSSGGWTIQASGYGWLEPGRFTGPSVRMYREEGLAGGVELVEGEQFAVKGYLDSYGNAIEGDPVDPGFYTVLVEGLSPYYGSRSVGFEVKAVESIIPLEFGEKTQMTLEQYEERIFSFTAPLDGTYSFICFGTNGSSAFLYDDISMKNVLDSMDGENWVGNVAISAASVSLTTGQTVYLRTSASEGSYDVLVDDGKNLEVSHASADGLGMVSMSRFKAPRWNLYAFDTPSKSWEELSFEVDYRISGYLDADGVRLSGEPTQAGSYFAVLEGTGDFHGETTAAFEVVDDHDLRAFSAWVEDSFVATGAPVTEPAVVVSRYDDFGDVEVRLVQNRDFRVKGYQDSYGNDLETAPSEPGDYSVLVEGVGAYTGETIAGFRIEDPRSLTLAQVSAVETYYEYTGEPVSIAPEVVAYDGTVLEEGVHYTVACYSDSGGESLGSLPSEPGGYSIAIVATEDGGYLHSQSVGFEIVNQWDIGGGGYWDTYLSGYDSLLYTGSPVIIPEIVVNRQVEDSAVRLVQDTDFRIKHFADSDSNVLDGPPADIGEYDIVLEGIGKYTGERNLRFEIRDPRDINSYNLNMDGNVVANGGPIADPSLSVYRHDGQDEIRLVQNRDFRVKGYKDSDGKDLNDAPVEPGYYYVVVEGIGDYYGERSEWFTLWSPYDLDAFSAWVDGEVMGTGEPISEPDITVCRYDDEGVATNILVQNQDFRVKGYRDMDGSMLASPPSDPGEYYVVIEGIGDYFNEREAWLVIENPKDLSRASVEAGGWEYQYTGDPLSPLLTVTAYDGTLLHEGVHYDLVYYAGDDYELLKPLGNPPVEVGEYQVVAVAKEGGGCAGGTYPSWFSIVDWFDLTTNGWIGLADSISIDGESVYLCTGEVATPRVSVFADGDYGAEGYWRLTEGVDYELSYSDNVGPFEGKTTASVTATGIGSYHGSVVKKFDIVTSLDIAYLLKRGGVQIGWDGDSYPYSLAPRIEFFATGGPVLPSLTLPGISDLSFSSPADYTVSYIDSEGKPVVPVSTGDYRLVAKGVEGGVLAGSLEVPFSIVETKDIGLSDIGLSWQGGWSSSGPSDDTGFWLYGLLEDATDLMFTLTDGATALVEGLDYIVSVVRDGVYRYFTFEGVGRYAGTVRSSVYGQTAQEAFDDASVEVNGKSVSLWHGEAEVVLGASGFVQEPTIRMGSLVHGLDFSFGGIYDSSGNAVGKPTVGGSYLLRIAGSGAYDGCERMLPAIVVEKADPFDLSAGAGCGLTVDEALTVRDYDDGGYVSYLLKSITPNVGLHVYSQNVVLRAGQGITISRVVDSSGGAMKVTATAVEGSGYTGSRSADYRLVDKYDLAKFASYVRLEDGYFDLGGSATNPAELSYCGFSYSPSVKVGGKHGKEIDETCYSLSLFDSNGKRVSVISNASSYTAVLEGTGDWTGTLKVPITVSQEDSISLKECLVSVDGRITGEPNVPLRNGEARPTVRLSFGSYVLQEGRDYSLEYGNNKAEGYGYVTVEAVEGGSFNGQVSRGFKVGGEIDLARAGRLAYVDDSGRVRDFSYAPAVQLAEGVAELDVAVLVPDAKGTGTEQLDAGCYDVTFGNCSKPGTAWVNVEGKNGYAGSLSANYLVIDDPDNPYLAATASTSPVEVGATAAFTCSVEGAGSARLEYRWECSTDGGSSWFPTAWSGWDTAELRVEAAPSRLPFLWRCVVSASDGRIAATEGLAISSKAIFRNSITNF